MMVTMNYEGDVELDNQVLSWTKTEQDHHQTLQLKQQTQREKTKRERKKGKTEKINKIN